MSFKALAFKAPLDLAGFVTWSRPTGMLCVGARASRALKRTLFACRGALNGREGTALRRRREDPLGKPDRTAERVCTVYCRGADVGGKDEAGLFPVDGPRSDA